MNPAALLLLNLGRQMLFGMRSCAYHWSRLFIMSQRTGESSVTNAKKDYSNFVEDTNETNQTLGNLFKRQRQFNARESLPTHPPQPAFARGISKETRAYVLDRNGFTCQMCGAVAGEPHVFDPGRKTRLHLGHVIDKSMGGVDEPHKLRAICSVCNEGASNVTLQRPELNKLLVQVRRATALDQRELLLWLTKKFSSTKVQ